MIQTEKHNFHRDADRPLHVRFLHFWFAPWVDHWRGLSLTRFIAVVLTVAAVHGSLIHEQPITGMDVTMATLAVCTALGGKYILAFLNRTSVNLSALDSTARVRQEIIQRREQGKEFDAEPTG